MEIKAATIPTLEKKLLVLANKRKWVIKPRIWDKTGKEIDLEESQESRDAHKREKDKLNEAWLIIDRTLLEGISPQELAEMNKNSRFKKVGDRFMSSLKGDYCAYYRTVYVRRGYLKYSLMDPTINDTEELVNIFSSNKEEDSILHFFLGDKKLGWENDGWSLYERNRDSYVYGIMQCDWFVKRDEYRTREDEMFDFELFIHKNAPPAFRNQIFNDAFQKFYFEKRGEKDDISCYESSSEGHKPTSKAISNFLKGLSKVVES